MTTIRIARADEMEDLLSLLREGAAEQNLFPIDDQKARAMFNRAFHKRGGVVGVIGPKGHVEGAVYILIDQPLYSDQWLLTEVFNYVRPEFRKTANARAFISEAKKWALDMDIPLIMGVLSNERTEAKVRLYRRQLGNPVGAFFVFNTNWDQPKAVSASPYGLDKVA